MRTNAGRSFQARVMGNGAHADAGEGTMRPADYIALSANGIAPHPANVALAGEIDSGSLARTQATYVHTDGTDSYTLTNLFTSDIEVTVRKLGVFNAAVGGTLVFESLLNEVATLVVGDQIAITETVNL